MGDVVPTRGAKGAIDCDGGPAGGLSTLLAELARTPSRDFRAGGRGLKAGDVVGRFELGRELGRGGFGVVYEARDRELNRRVAFKVLRPGKLEQEPVRAELLRREAEAVAQLAHPNIVTLYDAGRSDHGPYLVLELLDGEPLDQRMARGPMAPPEAIRVALGIARALVHAHARGVLHRDLKPGNIFLTPSGEPKVLDFGLAHMFGLEPLRGAGTPGYMAPEQRRGEEEDARADVWAAGVLIWELLSGRRLGEQDSVEGRGAPRLEGPGIPPALADLVARCLAIDPEGRPHDAAELRDALEAIAGQAGRANRRKRLAAVAAVVTVVAGGLGWYLGLHRAAGAAEAVAIADAVNETGNPRLDGVAGMLFASLEQSRRVAVVPRERLRVLRDSAGFPASARVKGDGARAAAQRAGARLLLELSVTPGAPGFAFELRGIGPVRGDVRFALAERAPDEAAVPAAVDRLSNRVRAELGERAEDVRASGVQVGTALTTDLEAYRHYFLGEQCAARPVYGQDCSPHFRRAAELDPGFAAAHYQLALWSFWYGAPLAEQLATIAQAVAHAGAAPEKERLLIQAWDAWLHGRDEDALATYRIVTERWPQDRSGWFQSGEILRRREELAAAIPWFERAVAVDPEYGWALSHLVVCLGATGRRDDLTRWASRWEASARPAELHALVLARGWLGDLPAADAAAKRAIAMGGGVAAQEDLLAVWAFAGRYAEVEAAVRELASPGSEVRPMGYYALAAMEGYRGRRRAGEATLDALREALPGIERQALYHSARIEYLLGDHDPVRVAREVVALRALEPRAAAEHAAEVAWIGDLALGESLAADLRPGSVLRRTHDAVARFRRGETDAGLADLRGVAGASPVVTWRVAPVFLLGELAAEAGRCEEAVAALRQFQAAYQPIAMWRSWALSRSRALIATCEAGNARTGSAGR